MSWFKKGTPSSDDDKPHIPVGDRLVTCPRCGAEVKDRFKHKGGHKKLDDSGNMVDCE